MRIASFIVVDDYKRIKSGGICAHTVNGTVLYPLETSLPIIQKGKGCIGLGMVSEITMTTSSTRIVFSVSRVDDDDAKAYYRLYQNQVSTSNDEDVYDASSDMVIPGMMVSSRQPKISDRDRYDSQNHRPRSLSDYMRDNDY